MAMLTNMHNFTNDSDAENITNTSNLNNTCRAKNTFEGLAYSPLFLFGLIINFAALCAFFVKHNAWTDTHIYIFNLVLADSIFVIFLPFRIYDTFFCLRKTIFCTVLISIHYINMYVSILTTTAISVQRYLCVRFPLQARSWMRKKAAAGATCVIIWVTVVSICAAFHKQNEPDKLGTCYERRKDKPLKSEFLATLIIFGYSIPLLLVIFCSTWVIWTLSKEEGQSPLLQKSITRIVTANMVVFVVCYTPVHVAFLLNYYASASPEDRDEYKDVYQYLSVAEWIAATNCFFDSFCFYFLLRNTFLRLT